MKTMSVKEWLKKVCSVIYRPGDGNLDQRFQIGFQELYCRNVFMLKSHRLNLNKLVFLKLQDPLESLTYKYTL